jgi:hypothetical protein
LSGGTQTFNQRVRVYNTGTLGVSGSAALSTGSLEVPGGDVNQSGGGVTVSGGLTLNGAGSSYNISAGGLRVWDLNVDNGLFNISGSGANIEVRNNLRFGPNGTFQAVPGSAIHMTGAAFQNERTSPAALAGLHSLALIFEGGAATVDTFEVAGRDLGPLPEGFVDNFELGRLILGGADIGNVRLVDYLDNLLTWPENQALYVNYLEVGSNSRLDLNGLNLYYMDASIDPTALIEYGGGQLRQMVPEPMTLLVLGGGLLAVLRRRIRK